MRKELIEKYFKPLFSVIWKPTLLVVFIYLAAHTLQYISRYFFSADSQLLIQTTTNVILLLVSGFFIYFIFSRIINFFTPKLYTINSLEKIIYPEYLISIINKDLKFLLALIIIFFFSRSSFISYDISIFVQNTTNVLIILTIAIILGRLVSGYFQSFSLRHMPETVANPLLRKTITQLQIVKNSIFIVIGIIAISGICMLFDNIKEIGMSILASAGVLTIILGIAARESFSGFFAAIRIAISQPIRINDSIVFDDKTGQGQVEEITFSYVIIKLWDLRRLIVPISKFTEQPFINLTRQTTELLGTVFLHLDYSAPLEPIRNEFTQLINHSPLWDKQIAKFHVTDLTENSMEIRLLVSAADSDKLWDLRCWLRENLVSYIQLHYPDAFPKFRGNFYSPLKKAKDRE